MMTRRVVFDITHGFPGFSQALKFDVRKTLTAQRDKNEDEPERDHPEGRSAPPGPKIIIAASICVPTHRGRIADRGSLAQ